MKLRYKLNLLALSVLFVVASAITVSGVLAIGGLSVDLNKRLMYSEINHVIGQVEDAQEVLRLSGVAGVKSYILATQADLVHELTDYHLGRTGELMIITLPDRVVLQHGLDPGAVTDIAYLDKMTREGTGILESAFRGKKYFFAYAKNQEWNWLITIAITAEEMFEQRDIFLRNVTLILLFSLVFGSLIFVWFAKGIVDPILQLARSAVGISKGEWDQTLPEPRSGDEVGDLTRVFREMTERLAAAHKNQAQHAHELQTINLQLNQEIEERKQAKQALQLTLARAEDSRDKMDTILRSVNHGLIVTDMNHRIVMMNRETEELLGLDLQDVLMQSAVSVIKEQTLIDYFNSMQIPTEVEIHDLELTDFRLDERRVYQAGSSIVRSSSGSAKGMVTTLVDVTKDRELDRLKSEFIATAAHELNTPLTAVMGFAELLLNVEEHSLDKDQQKDFLETIYRKGEKLSRITEELLQLSSMERGRELFLEPEFFDIQKEMSSLIFHHKKENSTHTIINNFSEHLPEIYADRVKVSQVLDNLLTNAIKYSPRRGKIKVSGGIDGDTFVVEVEDQGIGMTPEQRERVFEKFYRADSSLTAVGGLGLGMSIVQDIIEAHQGEIFLESRLGKGTRVTVRLPLKQANNDLLGFN